MDKARLTTLIQEPHHLTIDDAEALKKLKEEFPYFQALTPLLVLSDKKFKPSAEKKSLPTAAIYALDRKHLKKLLQKEAAEITGNSSTPAPAHNQKTHNPPHIEVNEDHLPDSFFNELFVEMESLKKSKERYRRILEKLEQEDSKPAIKKPTKTVTRKSTTQSAKAKKTTTKSKSSTAKTSTTTTKKAAAKKTKPTPKKEVKKNKKETDDLHEDINHDLINEIKLKEKKEINDQHKKEQIALITNFIENEPVLTKKFIESDPDAKRVIEDLSVSSTSLSEDVVSETLAKLMVKQGRNQKAIDIYKKLIWKFPQKKTYFAEQIEKLKREQ